MGEKKSELIQIRVNAELKKRFFEVARERGYDPSEFLRNQMERVINENVLLGNELKEMKSKLDETRQLLDEMRWPVMEMLSLFSKISNRTSDEMIAQQVDGSSIRDFYIDYAKDMAHEESHDLPNMYHQRLDYWIKRGLEVHSIPEHQPLGDFMLPGGKDYWEANRQIIKEEEGLM